MGWFIFAGIMMVLLAAFIVLYHYVIGGPYDPDAPEYEDDYGVNGEIR